MLGMKDDFTYIECAACGCLQIGSYPRDIGKYYPSSYYSFRSVTRVGLRGRVRTWLGQKRDRYVVFGRGRIGALLDDRFGNEKVRQLAAFGLQSNASILDVGCGGGMLLRELRAIGFRSLTGIDAYIQKSFSPERGIQIRKSDLAAAAGSFDLVMLHHSLEHMPNQEEQLREVVRLMKPDGQCLIRVPLADSLAWSRYGTEWVQLDAPRHFYLHTRRSLQIVALRAGLDLVSMRDDSNNFQFVGSELYRRGISLSSAVNHGIFRFFSPDQISAFDNEAEALNREHRGDQGVFVFRKRGARDVPVKAA